MLKGLLLPFAKPDQVFLDLLLRLVQIGVQSRLADDAKLHFMTTPRLLVHGHLVEIVGSHLNGDQIAFLKVAAVNMFDE